MHIEFFFFTTCQNLIYSYVKNIDLKSFIIFGVENVFVLKGARVLQGDTLSSLFTTNVNKSNKRKEFHTKKRQEANDIPQKLLLVQIIKRFSQITVLKPNLSCIADNKRSLGHKVNSDKIDFMRFN